MKHSTKKFFSVFLTCLLLLGVSFNNSVAFAQSSTYNGAATDQMDVQTEASWAAIAAGVAVVSAAVGTVKAAYDIGTIVGHALHDAFGSELEMSASAIDVMEAASYDKYDFSAFNPAS